MTKAKHRVRLYPKLDRRFMMGSTETGLSVELFLDEVEGDDTLHVNGELLDNGSFRIETKKVGRQKEIYVEFSM